MIFFIIIIIEIFFFLTYDHVSAPELSSQQVLSSWQLTGLTSWALVAPAAPLLVSFLPLWGGLHPYPRNCPVPGPLWGHGPVTLGRWLRPVLICHQPWHLLSRVSFSLICLPSEYQYSFFISRLNLIFSRYSHF